ncbi:MAG TPA: FecR domain-containing protein [Candidatus Polarisedimenticolaceae bacterium]|nr:FecR domain-containing protein [Candidatus Polarisedimenticolaceae bacterium]
MARETTSTFQIEWFNVTYRSVFSVLGVVVLLVGGGAAYWYYFHVHAPRAAAVDAIARAESKVAEAAALDSSDDRLADVVASAQVALREARQAFGVLRFDEARAAAIRSENLSQQAIGLVKGVDLDARMVRFYRLEGDVRIKRAGQFSWESASTRTELAEGDQIKTSSKGSAEVIFFDGSITRIEPGSLYKIREVQENPHTKERRVREELAFGELKASTQKRNVEGSFHEVKAGEIEARAEEATEFRVTAEEGSKKAAVDVFQGQIEVASSDRRENVVAGERISAGADGKLRDKEVLPGIPALVSPRDQKVFILAPDRPQPITLAWDSVPGAERYHLLISDKTLFTEPLYDAERNGSSALIDEVPEGAYYWKVAAIGANGVRGPFSAARRFRVSSHKILDRSDTEPPSLEITEFVAVGPMVVVNGRTEPGATLWVDNEKQEVFDDGQFSTVVRLRRDGMNEIRFVAQDTAGNETELTRAAYVEVY